MYGDDVLKEGGDSIAVFGIHLNKPAMQSVTVQYSTADGSLVAGQHYSPVAGTLHFPAGTTNASVTVPLLRGMERPDGFFYLRLSSPIGAYIGDAESIAWIVSPIASWRNELFGVSASMGNADDLVDLNGNGIVNLVEYALGGDPVTPGVDRSILPRPELGAGGVVLYSLTRYPDRNDITITVEETDSLTSGTWANVARSENGAAFIALQPDIFVSETEVGAERDVSISNHYFVADPARNTLFMRLRVNR